MNIFEGLLNYPRGDGEPVPGVATHYEISDGGTFYTFHLRKNAKWSDGKPVTAQDFKKTWLRKLEPATASKSAEHLWYIKGAKPFNEGKIKDPEQVGIQVVDPHTLTIRLEHPHRAIKWLFASSHYAPSPDWVVQKHGDKWTRPGNIVSNGPYIMLSHRERDRVVLAKNPMYWDKDNVKIEEVRLYETDSETAAFQWYETGKIHWLPDMVPEAQIDRLRAAGRRDLNVVPMLCVYFYMFRVDKPPFDDVRVRRAFQMAIDKERLTAHLLKGGEAVAEQLVPNMFQGIGYESPRGDSFDPGKARKLLATAGYPGGKGFPEVELIYNSTEKHRSIAQFIQRNVKEHLNVTANLRNMEWKSLLKKLNAGDFNLSRFGWCGLNDPYSFVKIARSDSPNNHTGFASKELDALLDRAVREGDMKTRNQLVRQIESVIQEQLPYMPLYFYTNQYLLKPTVCGLDPNPENIHLFKYMWRADSCLPGQK
jgi:oligopeptide transport system substrate-binding protein